MSTSRLSTALADGSLRLPTGDVTLIRPPATYDVSSLQRESVRVVHGFYPDATAWQAAGFPVSRNVEGCAVAVVIPPRSKTLGRALVAEACRNADLVVVDGQKTDGVDSLFKACRQRLGNLLSITKAHGRIFWFPTSDEFEDWTAPPPAVGPYGFVTTAGVFSDGTVDPGSALLVDALPEKLPARMADLGAGWGYLSHHVLKRASVAALDLIEAEALSLDCARQNVTDMRASFHWNDAKSFEAPAYDGIVMNPPFHTGRQADPALGRAFIAAAARLLAPQGKLWMVANRHLPYEATLSELFRNVDIIGGNSAFKLFHATKPKR
ncbi:class I SAM-dependent methyltransferase [Yoonia litorea]|uniref:16S rRNA m(2)G 1207 methyltransferase n=1 Tax=Yoonia litorea TaxID=1123755 RepID=A0A1I6LC92_9RHOB|nr:class I SAM-dependent methyltransferase [Yoonia litorea]SFS01085.1 16S rRNA m(2)G 1207 methyltransferase [Yoonia litorea]